MSMTNVGERIKARRKALNLTQQQLADIFSIARVSVTQWENGQTRPDTDKISGLVQHLGGQPEDYMENEVIRIPSWQDKKPLSTERYPSNASIGGQLESTGHKIPVYGQAVGGVDGEFLMNGSMLYEVMAPPRLSKVSGAYAVIVSGDSMAPRYVDGETAYIDPTRRIKKGDYVVAQIQYDEHGPILAFVKKFIRHNDVELVLSQFNPEKELVFPHLNVVSVHYIALSGDA